MLCTKPFKPIHSFFKKDEYGAAAVIGVAIAASVSCPIIPVAAGGVLASLAAIDATVATGKGLVWTAKQLLAYQRGKAAQRRADQRWEEMMSRPKPDPALLKQQAIQAALSQALQKRDLKVSMSATLPEDQQESWIAAAEREYRLRLIELMNQA